MPKVDLNNIIDDDTSAVIDPISDSSSQDDTDAKVDEVPESTGIVIEGEEVEAEEDVADSAKPKTDGVEDAGKVRKERTDADLYDEASLVSISTQSSEDSKWYVVHTYSGHENKVAVTLKQRAEASGFLDRIFNVLIPTQRKIVINEGKKRNVEERLFPGYILVQMHMSDDAWHLVRSTRGVTGFVGAGATPTALPESEVKALMKFMKMDAPRFEARFSVGDSVKITEGPYADFLAKVAEVNEEQGRVKVMITTFGREVPAECDLTQVTRI